jgi:hypothetical protein
MSLGRYTVVGIVITSQLGATVPLHEPHPIGEQPTELLPMIQVSVATTGVTSAPTRVAGGWR